MNTLKNNNVITLEIKNYKENRFTKVKQFFIKYWTPMLVVVTLSYSVYIHHNLIQHKKTMVNMTVLELRLIHDLAGRIK